MRDIKIKINFSDFDATKGRTEKRLSILYVVGNILRFNRLSCDDLSEFKFWDKMPHEHIYFNEKWLNSKMKYAEKQNTHK